MSKDGTLKINLPAEDEKKLRDAAASMGISASSLAYILLYNASFAFCEFRQIGPHNRDKVRSYVRKSVEDLVEA